MIKNIRTIVHATAATAVLISGLGVAAVEAAGTANAAVCWEQWGDGSWFQYYC
jgi:hypothetical protein